MITEVIMKRKLLDGEVSQKSKSGFLSLTELVRLGNKWRIQRGLEPFKQEQWFRQKSTKEFMKTLEEKFGKVKISGGGRGHHTWVHPYLFIDAALSINPTLKIEIYSWLYDNLLKYRDDSGDSYKKMTGSVYLRLSNKSTFRDTIINIAKTIKRELGITSWQEADEKTLKLRDKVHEYIALYCDVLPVNDAVRISIKRAREATNERH